MTPSGPDGQRPVGLVVGSLIGIAFGLIFIEVNSEGLPPGWSLAIRIGGAVVAAALVAGVVWVWLFGSGVGTGSDAGPPDRRFWAVVGGEAVALVGGLALINSVLGQPQLAVAWIALVVGLHFVVLAPIVRIRAFYVLGGVLSALGVTGFVLGVVGAPEAAIGLVSGVCSGVALFATVAASLLGFARHVRSVSRA